MAAQDAERQPLLPRPPRPSEEDEEIPVTKKAGWWLVQHVVIIVASLLLVAVIIILCVFLRIQAGKTQLAKRSVCQTSACIHASSEILYNLSPQYKKLDPCTNFEELVCGGWNDRHDLRPDQGHAFTGTIMSENSEMLLRHILEAPYPKDSKHSNFSPSESNFPFSQPIDTASPFSIDEENFNKLKRAYNACMDETTIKKQGAKRLLQIIHEIAKLFPITNADIPRSTPPIAADDKSFSDVVTYLQKLRISALISLDPGADDKNPDSVVVQASPPRRVGLPAQDYYKDEEILEKYKATLSQVLTNLKIDPKKGNGTFQVRWSRLKGYRPVSVQAVDLSGEVIELEKKLAAASPSTADSNDVTKYYNLLSLEDADNLTPKIGISKIINSLAPVDFSPSIIIVSSPDYMKNLTGILDQTSRQALQAYFMWKAIQSFSSVTEADEIAPYRRFTNELAGKDPDSIPDRWRTCVGHVDDGLGWILSRFFIEKAFSEKAKNFGDQIVSDIKEMFIEKLKKTTWMDPSVAELAIEKVHKIVQKIGYPTKTPDIMNPANLRDYYTNINITSTMFFDNAVSMKRFDVDRSWSTLGKPVDRDAWDMTVPTVNAYYNPPGNEIVFPAGIMQFPVFDVDVPQYISYGAFGSVSGHELSHAFDSTGRHYDQNGNYTDWWTNSTITNFESRAQCFVDQYSKYTVPGPENEPLHVNGELTLGENIADAGGVAASFAAWKKRQAATPIEDLPGLEYFSQDQLFFVSYANWWCGKSRKEAAITRIYSDPHAPKWARILGTMANSRNFKESFQCYVKDPVCELW